MTESALPLVLAETRTALVTAFSADLHRLYGAIGQSVSTICERLITHVAKALEPVIQAVRHAARVLGLIHRRKRSSRRLNVQAKRQALGLNPSGRYNPPTWYVNYYGQRGTRKEERACAEWEQRALKRI